jgi:myo-inositol 2-dehydrogenase / D-chiro-inositol 1-dehydrogenase
MRGRQSAQPLRVGVVGTGAISAPHVQAWRTLGADVVVQSRSGRTGLPAPRGVEVVTDLDDLLERSDIVDICTPTPTHPTIALAAIQAGRHVVCEKPLARTSVQAQQMCDAAAAAGRWLLPAHVVRFFPAYAELKAAVDRADIGSVTSCEFTRASATPVAPGNWFADEAASGGIVLDQMIHDLDMARWVAGEVLTVRAVQDPPSRDGGVPALVSAEIELGHAGGARSQLLGRWGPAETGFQTSFRITGTVGLLVYDSAAAAADNTPVRPGEAPADELETSVPTSPYLAQLSEFASAIAGGPLPRVSCSDGVVAVALAEAALESVRTGEPVMLEPGG